MAGLLDGHANGLALPVQPFGNKKSKVVRTWCKIDQVVLSSLSE